MNKRRYCTVSINVTTKPVNTAVLNSYSYVHKINADNFAVALSKHSCSKNDKQCHVTLITGIFSTALLTHLDVWLVHIQHFLEFKIL